MGSICLGQKKKHRNVNSQILLERKKKPKKITNKVLITSTPPIETPDLSMYLQNINNHTPKSEYSRKNSSRLQPIKTKFDSSDKFSFDEEKYSFLQSRRENEKEKYSFEVYGESVSRVNASYLKENMKNISKDSLKNISKNDLLLMSEDNENILKYLTNQNSKDDDHFERLPQMNFSLKTTLMKPIYQTPKSGKSKIKTYKICIESIIFKVVATNLDLQICLTYYFNNRI